MKTILGIVILPMLLLLVLLLSPFVALWAGVVYLSLLTLGYLYDQIKEFL